MNSLTAPILVLAGHGPRRWLGLADEAVALALPIGAVRHRLTAQLHGDGRDQARDVLAQMQAWHDQGFAVAGWLGYELGAALERVPLQVGSGLPDVDVVAFEPRDMAKVRLPPTWGEATQPTEPTDLLRQEPVFLANVIKSLASIAAGEVYQVNVSVAARVPSTAQLLDMPMIEQLAALLAAQSVPLALAWQGEGWRLLSGSMERFLRVTGDRVSCRPIKGTAPRRQQVQADQEEAALLRASAKECAENTMIVDMVRNDLQRACAVGSIRVPHLLQAEPYATLWHLESEVTGRLRDPHDGAGLLAATLPPASVTGCPKIQAMHVIARLEQRRRGPYCGTAGVWWPDGRADWSVGIRQVVLERDGATVSVGAGIVADSNPAQEWAEVCLKARGALRWLAACSSGREA